MVYWSLDVGQRLTHALKFIQQMEGMVEFEHPDMLYLIERKGTAKSQPQATAELLLFFFKSTPKHFYASEHVGKVWADLKAAGIAPDILKKIREAMLALGHDPEQQSS